MNYKKNYNTYEEFLKLPVEVQEEVKIDLGGYPDTTVYFENGKYKITPHICIRNEYPKDFKFIGEFKMEDILTIKEQEKYSEQYFGYNIYKNTRIENRKGREVK